MLEKLSEAYASFVATMDTKWINYTFANFQMTIYKILKFFKAHLLKIFYAFIIPNFSQYNNRFCLSPVLPVYSHLICLSKKLYYLIDKCWELHPKLWPKNWCQKFKLLDMRVKKSVSSTLKNQLLIFNFSWLSKVLAINILFSKKNLWLFDFAADVYICNNQNIFLKFVKMTTALSGVTS